MKLMVTFDLVRFSHLTSYARRSETENALHHLNSGSVIPLAGERAFYSAIDPWDGASSISRYYHSLIKQRLNIPLKDLITICFYADLDTLLGSEPEIIHLKLLMNDVPEALQRPVAIADYDDLINYETFAYDRFMREIVLTRKYLEWPCKSTPDLSWSGKRVMQHYPSQTNRWFTDYAQKTIKIYDIVEPST